MPLLAERGFSILDCVLLRVKVSTTEIGASPLERGLYECADYGGESLKEVTQCSGSCTIYTVLSFPSTGIYSFLI